jgi:hypothetical protein
LINIPPPYNLTPPVIKKPGYITLAFVFWAERG